MAELPELNVDLAEGPKPNAKYDIFPSMASFFDPHMLYPVLDFLLREGIYDGKELTQTKLEISKRTMMSDYTIQIYQEIHGEDASVPSDLTAKKAADESAWVEAKKSIDKFAPFFDTTTGYKTELMDELAKENSFEPGYLAKEYGITADDIEALYKYAKVRYETAEYYEAAAFLTFYRELVPTDSTRSLRALWGKLAADILSQQFDQAEKDRETLRDVLARGAFALTDLELLQHRTWLLHWSLFIFANTDEGKGKEPLVEFFLNDAFSSAIQLNAPWLLRYLAVCILTSRKRHAHTKLLLRMIAQEATSYRDPILEFIEALLLNFDFDGAQHKLAECESVIVTDYFLASLTTPSEFMDSARRFIFETYCRIHEKIGLDTLSSKLHMTEEDAERWLVDLMRTASLDAKIDSVERRIVMSVPATSVYQQVVERTRDLTTRTRNLADGIDAALEEGPAGEKAGQQRGGGYKGDYENRGGARGGQRGGYSR